MLASAAAAGRAGAARRKGVEPRGPQTVPCYMWVVWVVLNSALYWRYTAPARPLLPLGEKLRLGDDAVMWRSPDRDVELVLAPGTRRMAGVSGVSGETAWVLSVHNAFRSELVQLHAGFHISLHPLRQSALVQISRSSLVPSATHVKIATNKKRLTRNTFVSNIIRNEYRGVTNERECKNEELVLD